MADNKAALEWMKKVNKDFGSELVTIGVKHKELELIPFTSLRLTYMSYGGVPRGRATEIYGGENSGKSTLCLDLMKNFQELYPDELILYVDVENTYDDNWAANMGVDSSKIVLLPCYGQYAEKLFNQIIDAMNTGCFGLIILDSIGSMFSKQTSEKSIEEKTYGGIALAMTTFVNMANPIVSRNNIAFVAINQTRANIGNMYEPISTPGGKAWKFWCSQRYMCRKGKFLDVNGNECTNSVENPAGHLIEVKLVKSKTCPSDRRIAKCSLFYRNGIRQDLDLLDLALKFDVIHKAGAWFSSSVDGTERKWQGQAKVLETLNAEPEFFNFVRSKVQSLLVEDPNEDTDESISEVPIDD